MKMASRSTDLISKKANLHVQQAFFFSNLQKLEFERVARFLVFLCHSFVRLQCRFVRLKSQTSELRIILMDESSYVLTKDFVSCVHVRFYVFTAAHFHLAGR